VIKLILTNYNLKNRTFCYSYHIAGVSKWRFFGKAEEDELSQDKSVTRVKE